MDVRALVRRLERFPAAVRAAVGCVEGPDACWRPDGRRWSILEIVSHLADEEAEDFRPRLQRTLRNPAESWPAIDPERWAIQRRYIDRELAAELARFERERSASVAWLGGLVQPDWHRAHDHPRLGVIRAGDLLAAWSAHDALHLRQIAKRLYELAQRDAGGYSADYAGAWTA